MPSGINWGAMKEVYEFQPGGYEELVGLRGVGPATVRGLALVAELVYGEPASWVDPVRFSFAFGERTESPSQWTGGPWMRRWTCSDVVLSLHR